MAPTEKRKDPSMLAALGLASGIGLQLAASVLVGLGLGYLADRAFHTSPWFLLVGLLLGVLAGGYRVVRMVMKEMRRSECPAPVRGDSVAGIGRLPPGRRRRPDRRRSPSRRRGTYRGRAPRPGQHGLDGGNRQAFRWIRPNRANAPNRGRHALSDDRRPARRGAHRQPRRPGRRRHWLRLLSDRGRGRRVAHYARPTGGDRVMTLPLLQIDVTHPTINIAGLDFNTDTIRNTLIVCGILLILGVILRSQLRVGVPTQLQNAMEAIVEYINNLTEETLQGRNVTLGPLAITLMTFLLVANWLGLVPGLKSPTNDWNTTLGLALMSFVLVQYYSIRSRHLGGYFKHLLLVPPYFPLSVIDELAKPITLSFRLYFNIFVGELLLSLIITLVPTWISWLPGAVWTLFSLFIGTVQAFIFTVLTVSYVAIATEVETAHA